MAADPGQKRHPPQHDEGVDLDLLRRTQVADRPITPDPGGLERGDAGIVLDEADRGGEIIKKPAPAAIVEVDQPRSLAVDQQVGQPHVRMDQVEACGRLAEGHKAVAHHLLHLLQNPGDLGRDLGRVAPVAPGRGRAENRFLVPGQALEIAWLLPAKDMLVAARGNRAKLLIPRRHVAGFIGGGTFDEVEEHHVARGRESFAMGLLDRVAIAAGINAGGDDHARLVQCLKPSQLAFDRAVGVVILPVNAQDRTVAARRLDQIGRVFGDVDQPRRRAVRHVPKRQGRLGQIVQMAQQFFQRHVGTGHRALLQISAMASSDSGMI